jgi:hypothetical protein
MNGLYALVAMSRHMSRLGSCNLGNVHRNELRWFRNYSLVESFFSYASRPLYSLGGYRCKHLRTRTVCCTIVLHEDPNFGFRLESADSLLMQKNAHLNNQ